MPQTCRGHSCSLRGQPKHIWKRCQSLPRSTCNHHWHAPDHACLPSQLAIACQCPLRLFYVLENVYGRVCEGCNPAHQKAISRQIPFSAREGVEEDIGGWH